MSMIGNFLLLSAEEVTALKEAPESIHALLATRVYEPAAAVDHVDIEKAWHALHFLLTGTAWEGSPPLNFIVGGTEVGDEDVGYGPARLLLPAEVAELDRALDGIPTASLAARFDGAKMDALEIYPSGGWKDLDPTKDEEFGYFSGAYDDVRALVKRGAAQKSALLVWLN